MHEIYMCDLYNYFMQSFKDGVTDMNSFYIGAHHYFLNKDNYNYNYICSLLNSQQCTVCSRHI